MDQFSLAEIIFSGGNLFLLFLSIIFNFYQFKTNQKEKISSEIANNVINQIFLPLQSSLGINLYKKITPRNWDEFRSILNHFKEILDSSKESYYLSDAMQLSISNLCSYLKLDNLSKNDFKNLNKQFRKFSKNYLKEHSHFRQILHLPITGALYRIQFKLYSNIWGYLYLISKLSILAITFFSIFVLSYLVFFLYLSSWLFPFLSP